MRIIALALASTVCACSEDGEHVADVVHLGALLGATFADATIDDASEILGLDLIFSQAHGYVMIVERAPVPGLQGWTDVNACRPVLWAKDDPHVLAHELGHALGLEHVDDESNLMYPHSWGGTDLDDDQVDTMRHTAWHLQHECS